MKVLFYLSFFFITYTYIGYPCLLFILSRIARRDVKKSYSSPEPPVSVIIAVCNEEKTISKRMENILGQNYPADKIEIIIVSDGSTDGTNEIIKRWDEVNGQSRLKLFFYNENRGKAHALNIGVHAASEEIIVFTDARQQFEANAIKELVANFNDPEVGCVSGELVFREESESSIKDEINLYWNLEKQIRRLESSSGSVVGVTGAIYALRKRLFKPLPDGAILDDVFIPLNVIFHGYRNIFDGKAIAYDTVSKDSSKEKSRKIRTLLGNWQLILILPGLLSPWKNPVFLRFLSHKFFRLFVPFLSLIIFLSSFLIPGTAYRLVFLSSLLVIILFAINKRVSSIPVLGKASKLASVFIMLNYFNFLAFCQFVHPAKKKVW